MLSFFQVEIMVIFAFLHFFWNMANSSNMANQIKKKMGDERSLEFKIP